MKIDRNESIKKRSASGLKKLRRKVIKVTVGALTILLCLSCLSKIKTVNNEEMTANKYTMENGDNGITPTFPVSPTPTVMPTSTPTPTMAPTIAPTPTMAPTIAPTPTMAPTIAPTPTIAIVITPTITPTPANESVVSPTPTIVPGSKGRVVLTYDDTPTEYTESILQVLNKYNVKATFFVEGRRAKNNPDIIQKIIDAGMEFGNHGWDHPNFYTLSFDEQMSQINRTDDFLYKNFNITTAFFRPPYGNLKENVADDIDKWIFNWDIDSEDWNTEVVSIDEAINVKILPHLHNGAIILLHNVEREAEISDIIIPAIRAAGYEVGSISQVIEYEEANLEKGVIYRKIKK